jgi:uncharacterized protein DUF3987/DNA primase RepB-like protein
MSTTEQSTVLDFFERLYQHDEGYAVICTTRPPARRDTFHEEFFQWPKQKKDMIEYIDKVRSTHNVYFCVNIMSVPRRKKENAIPQNLVWADLDTCAPDKLEIPPHCVIESSPNRYQAIWRLDRKVDPLIAENYSKRIAYMYAELGADKSGHDLTQLLRVPDTYNFKYMAMDAPLVILKADLDGTLTTDVFDALPLAEASDDTPDLPVPALEVLPSYDMVFYRYVKRLEEMSMANAYARYVSQEPPDDWSGHMWRLLLLCFEVGMTAEEAFVVAMNAACNKYERDGRPISHLWREVLKAELQRKSVEILLADHRSLIMPALLTLEEEESLPPTILDDYMAWAVEATDAVPDFHEICCTMVMSSLMSTTLRLHTSGNKSIVPNLWAMILGESTLTRKTTAMDMAMDFVLEIDKGLMLGSDASVEGLLTDLSQRPKMVSIFYRDEVTGFFDSIQRKDYLAGMHETMTKMYDVPPYMIRSLKKDKYIITEPIFIFFGGGVPDKMYSLINENYFTSGFMPRFLMMRGYGDLGRIRPLGPPTGENIGKRDELLSTFKAYYEMYTNCQREIVLPNGDRMLTTPDISVTFTPEMWERCASIEMLLIQAAHDSPEAAKALPSFNRLYVSMLKLAMLFAAARQEPTEDLVVRGEMRDLLCAASYVQKWGVHTVDIVRNSGVGADESKLLTIYRSIEKAPGIGRAHIMQRHRVNAPTMDVIETTLIQRSMIEKHKKGNATTYWPIGR